MPTINGTSGGDNLVGTNGPDTLNGFEGDDALDGNGGVDQLFGGPGDDSFSIRSPPLAGGVFDGGEGSDRLYVSLQAKALGATSVSLIEVSLVSLERLFFGETLGLFAGGDQKIQISWSQLASFFPQLIERPTGPDTFDILVPNAGTYRIPDFLKSWGSTDTISLTATGTGDYTLSASGSSVGIEALNGAGGNDQLNGNSLINFLGGGSGNDTLVGGAGADRLTGGLGNDTFIDTRAGLDGDAITDFTVADRIVLTDATLATFTFSLNGNTLTYSGGSLTFSSALNGTLMASSAISGGVQLAIEPSTINDVRNDFNGDRRSDVLWRNLDGTISNWLGTDVGGFTINDAHALVHVPSDWIVYDTGDFNGDGRADILWRSASGFISDWLGTMEGGWQINDAAALAQAPDVNWIRLGIGDFNGDGRDDILWQETETTGERMIWYGDQDGGFAPSARLYPLDPPHYTFSNSIGDFNGDGRDDLLWRDVSSGSVGNWLVNAAGDFVLNSPMDGKAFSDWTLEGVGDFNGDGRDDLLWRSSTGTVSNWLANADGTLTANDAAALRNVPLSWHIEAVGDYNGDGRADILWRHNDGAFSNWLATESGGWLINDAKAFVQVSTEWSSSPFNF